jgi:thiol-disulfide isomerase/thioredoxin
MRICLLLISLLLLAPSARANESLTLVGGDGAPVEIQPADGQLLLLHFWATWCPTCVVEIRDLQKAASDCPAQRVRVVLVDVGEDDAVVRSYVAEHGIELPVLRDPDGKVWNAVDGRGLPTNLFWSSVRRESDVGPRNASEWRSALASWGCSASGA